MTFFAFGLNHESAPVTVREAFALSERATRRLYASLSLSDEAELILLSTCNRTEAYLFGTAEDRRVVLEALCQEAGQEWPEEKSFLLEDEEAVRHVLQVACGLRSLVLGETQILSQVKEAYRLAVDAEQVEAVLHRLMHTAFRTAKRVVRETKLTNGAASISSAAVELARTYFKRHYVHVLRGRRVLLVGMGRMGILALKVLRTHELASLAITNRTEARSQEAADTFNAAVVPWEARQEAIEEADLVLVATGADEPVVTADDLAPREGVDTLVIDIAVPRNVAPEVDDIPGYSVFDLDTLNDHIVRAEEQRRRAVPNAEEIVDEELSSYVSWFFHQQALKPAIHALRSTFDSIRRQEIERHKHRFSDADREELDQITRSIMQKLLAVPIVRLKSTDPESIDFVRGIKLLNSLFSRPGCDEEGDWEDEAATFFHEQGLDPGQVHEHLDLFQALHASEHEDEQPAET